MPGFYRYRIHNHPRFRVTIRSNRRRKSGLEWRPAEENETSQSILGHRDGCPSGTVTGRQQQQSHICLSEPMNGNSDQIDARPSHTYSAYIWGCLSQYQQKLRTGLTDFIQSRAAFGLQDLKSQAKGLWVHVMDEICPGQSIDLSYQIFLLRKNIRKATHFLHTHSTTSDPKTNLHAL